MKHIIRKILRETYEEDLNQPSAKEIINITKKIDSYGLGSPIWEFLTRVAKVESCYGTHAGTNTGGGGLGPWQIDKIAFQDTKNLKSHPNLKNVYKKLYEKSKIDWNKVQYSDMTKPLYSALAARILLLNKPGSIPSDEEGQAQYWKTHYNTSSGGGTVEDFLNKSCDDVFRG